MSAIFAAGALAWAALLWWFAPLALEVAGLSDLGELGRIGVIILGLSLAQAVLTRVPQPAPPHA
ncbi:MAG: hypothetical protein AB7F35_04575 [Acetobacteraceae bacterium]